MPPACAMAMASLRLGHGIHRRRDDRKVEGNRPGELRPRYRFAGKHRPVAGLQQDVVEGERLAAIEFKQSGHANPRNGKADRRP